LGCKNGRGSLRNNRRCKKKENEVNEFRLELGEGKLFLKRAGDPIVPPPLLAFTANFGPGFYWFAGYCLFSLAAQQMTAGWFSRPSPEKA